MNINVSTIDASTTFAEIVAAYAANLHAKLRKTMDTHGDDSVPMEDWVMVTKVRKHLGNGDQRRAALYAKWRLEEFASPLSDWAVAALRRTPLKCNPAASQILFTSKSGELRAFNFVRAVGA